MRILVSLFLAVSMAAGLLGAAAAYLAPLGRSDSALVGLTLGAPAGSRPGPAGGEPIGSKGTRLTPELIETLRGAGVRSVWVTEFSLRRWGGAWLFLAGSAGLVCCAQIMRVSRRKAKEARDSLQGGDGSTPASILASIHGAVNALRVEAADHGTGSMRLDRVLTVLTQIQDVRVPDFVSWRPRLTEQLGVAGYARLMDRFAASERQINRAWSAAADGIEVEVAVCLDRAADLLGEAAARLPRDGPGRRFPG